MVQLVLVSQLGVLVCATGCGASSCSITVNASATCSRQIKGRGGILNGMNGSSPSDATISSLNLGMWRGPQANWLWDHGQPDRNCTGDIILVHSQNKSVRDRFWKLLQHTILFCTVQ
jgi:hypothetical protein